MFNSTRAKKFRVSIPGHSIAKSGSACSAEGHTWGQIMNLTRRDLLAVPAAAALMTTAAQGGALRKIGLQLYTVRDLLKSDFEATLRNVAMLGYREVEFAGILAGTPGGDVRQTRN